ncbi:hypothetical protein E4U54_000973 [Claviceps lovelessii]|nr:hypothetical protein E4U54_000973 [Claviceps lovelessii]
MLVYKQEMNHKKGQASIRATQSQGPRNSGRQSLDDIHPPATEAQSTISAVPQYQEHYIMSRQQDNVLHCTAPGIWIYIHLYRCKDVLREQQTRFAVYENGDISGVHCLRWWYNDGKGRQERHFMSI